MVKKLVLTLVLVQLLAFSCAELSVDWIYPTGDIEVSQNDFFNISVNVSCLTGFGDCGGINVSLDPISGSSDSEVDEWAMRGKDLRQTGYSLSNVPENISVTNVSIYDSGNSYIKNTPAVSDGYVYIMGDSLDRVNASNLSQVFETFSFSTSYSYGSPTVAEGYVYFTSSTGVLYQLNATNVSQQIATYNLGSSTRSSPVVYGGYLYTQEDDFVLQLNASDISQEIARYTGSGSYDYSSVAVSGGYVYATIGSYLQQLNASNVSQRTAYFNMGSSDWYGSPVVDEDNEYVYVSSSSYYIYQLNASDVSQEIARYNTGSSSTYSPQIVLGNGCIYFGSYDGRIYQLNATNISLEVAVSAYMGNRFIANYPVLTADYLFMPNTYQGMLFQMNASNASQEIGRYDIPAQTFGVSAAYGYVFVGSDRYVYRLGNFDPYTPPSKGLVSTTEGTTPYYTNVSNPYEITLNEGESQNILWWVNATGSIQDPSEFFVYANQTSNINISNQTSKLNVTIVDTTSPTLEIFYPAVTTYNTNISEINYSYYDLNSGYCWYSLDGGVSNSSRVSAGVNISEVSFSDGANSLALYCNDSSGNFVSDSVDFNIEIPSIGLEVTYPTSNVNVTQNQTFIVSARVTCNNADCGNVNVSLDPYTSVAGNYTAKNSTESGGDEFLWEEIIYNGEGTSIWSSSEAIDDSYRTITIPFDFPFYDSTYSTLYISSNGRIHFTTTSAGNTVVSLPNSNYPLVSPVNNDMYVRTYTQVYYKNESDRVIIQYDLLDHYSTGGDVTYQVILYDDGRIKFQYNASSESYTASSPIGINYNSTHYLFLESDTPDLHKGEAVTFYPAGYSATSVKGGLISTTQGATPFYTTTRNPYNLTLNQDESETITWTVNATGSLNTPYEFFVYANTTSGEAISNITSTWNVTIVNVSTCNPIWENTSWSAWQDQTSCRSNDTILQNRSLIQYDTNGCGVPNVTYWEYQEIVCDFCTPSLVNTSWSDWTNISCVSNLINQSRELTQYDENSCGEVDNETFYEYRHEISCAVSLSIISPENTTYGNATQKLNISSDGESVWYNWNGTNVTYTTPEYVTFDEGSNFLTVYANNSFSSLVSFSRIFGIDTTEPFVRIISPENSTYNTTRILLNISSDGESVWYNWNGTNVTYTTPKYVYFTNGSLNLVAYSSDSLGNLNSTNVSFFTYFDEDFDNVRDEDDRVIGNQSDVVDEGFSEVNLKINDSSGVDNFDGVAEVVVYDSSSPVINFTYNFSESILNLSRIKVVKSDNYLIVNLSGQLQEDYNKTIYLENNNFVSLCVKDSEVSSIDSISSSCDGENETDLTSCLQGNCSSNGINCSYNGSMFKISNLHFSAVRGVPESTTEESSSSGGGRSSSSGRVSTVTEEVCVPEWECDSWGFCSKDFKQTRACIDLNECDNDSDKPLEIRDCPDILFDSLVELITKQVYPWSDLKFNVNLKEVNQFDLVDVKVLYRISKNQKTVYEESETKAIMDVLEYTKSISDLDLAPGEYSLEVIIEYGENQTSSSEQNFSIVGSTGILIYLVIFILLGVLIFVAYNWYRSREHSEEIEEKLKNIEEKLKGFEPRGRSSNWWVDKIEALRIKSLEKRKSKLLDSNDVLKNLDNEKNSPRLFWKYEKTAEEILEDVLGDQKDSEEIDRG